MCIQYHPITKILKKTKNTQKKAKEWHKWHIPDTWHTSPNLKRKIPPTKNLGFQNQWIWPSCPGCPPGCLPRNPRCSKVESCWSRAIFQDPKALVFMAENLLFNGPKISKKSSTKTTKAASKSFLVILHAEPPGFFQLRCWWKKSPCKFDCKIPKLMIAYW